MASNTEINRLLYKFVPYEILAHLLGISVIYVMLLPGAYPQDLLILFGVIAALCLLRLLTVTAATNLSDSGNSYIATAITSFLIVLNLMTGFAWGGGIIWVAQLLPGTSELTALLPLLVVGVTMATLLGALLRPWLFLAFCIPSLGTPLAWHFWQAATDKAAIWAFLLLITVFLTIVIYKLRNVYYRYRKMGQQNAGLVQKFAAVKDKAIHSQSQIEQANEALKTKMEEVKLAEQKVRESEKETNMILQNMIDTFFRADAQGKIVRISSSIQFLLGYSPDETIDVSWQKFFFNQAEHKEFINLLDRNYGGIQNYEVRLRHMIGREVWVSINAQYYKDENEKVLGFEGTVKDVTAIRETAEILHQEKERLHVTLESIGDGVIATNMKGAVEYLNPVAETMTGWSEEKARGKPLAAVLKLVDEMKEKPVFLPMKKWLTDGRHTALSNPALLINETKNRRFAVELSGAPLKNSQGNIIGTVLVVRNVTKLRNLTTQLTYQATHDALTGLINRMEFETRVEQAIQSVKNSGKDHVVLYIDLDQFKVVNDTCGHHAGDELLKQLTALLDKSIRQSDTLARLGGDEFGVLLMGCSLHKSKEIAENLRRQVETFRFVWDNKAFRVGASIGLVAMTPDIAELDQLLNAADSACYVAKENGRNQVHVYQPDDQAVAQNHGQMQWLQRIHNALEKNLFHLYFQSIVAVNDPKTDGQHGEILLRMIDDQKHNKQDVILPNAFIPSAERYRLMPQIDRWVIQNTLYALADGRFSSGPMGTCSINVSGQSFGDLKLLNFVVDLIKETGVVASQLCFEITESAVVANIDVAKRFISKLKDMGCSFALDDFGSGMSSFAYLKNLPVDYLKLDGILINDIGDSIGYATVQAINDVAHVMGMKTVAEFVDSKKTLEALQSIKVDFAQGFLFDRPQFFAESTSLNSKAVCA